MAVEVLPLQRSEARSTKVSAIHGEDTSVENPTVIGKIPSMPEFTDKFQERAYLKGRLALAFRIFGKLGFDERVAGHITFRDPVDPTSFWVNPFCLNWRMLKASDLLLVNKKGEVVESGPCKLLNAAAFAIHHAVHTARPDVNCVAHSHTIHGRAFASLGRPLDIITQDSCAFYKDIALFKSFNGNVLDAKEGENIAQALGSCKAAILQNHGLLTVGETIEACIFWFISLEKCCHSQLLADAAANQRDGRPILIDDEEAKFTNRSVGSPLAGYFSAKPTFDWAMVKNPDYAL